MIVQCSYDGDPTIAAVRGPTGCLLDSLSELFMTGERHLKKWTIYLVDNKEQEKDCDI
jgi:hypothetical protein